MLNFDPVELGTPGHRVDFYVVEANGEWALIAYAPGAKRTWSVNYNEALMGVFTSLSPVRLREVRVGDQDVVEYRDAEGAEWISTAARVLTPGKTPVKDP